MSLTSKELKKWFKTQRTLYGKLSKPPVSGLAPKVLSEHQKWTLDKFTFIGGHIHRQTKARHPASLRMKLALQKASSLTLQLF